MEQMRREETTLTPPPSPTVRPHLSYRRTWVAPLPALSVWPCTAAITTSASQKFQSGVRTARRLSSPAVVGGSSTMPWHNNAGAALLTPPHHSCISQPLDILTRSKPLIVRRARKLCRRPAEHIPPCRAWLHSITMLGSRPRGYKELATFRITWHSHDRHGQRDRHAQSPMQPMSLDISNSITQPYHDDHPHPWCFLRLVMLASSGEIPRSLTEPTSNTCLPCRTRTEEHSWKLP